MTWRMRRIGAHSGQVALVCHINVLSWGYCSTTVQYSCLMEMQIFVGRVLHTNHEVLYFRITSGKQNTRQIARFRYLGCFWCPFCQGHILNKRRHYNAGLKALHMFHRHYSTRDWVVHLEKSNFCVRKTLFLVHKAWIFAHFDHLAAALGFRSSV